MGRMKTSHIPISNFVAALLVVIGMAAFPSAFKAQNDVLSISTDLVSVPVSVFDRSGKFVGGLNSDSFSLFENDLKQEIVHFDSTSAPFTVLMVLDTSGSMTEFMPDLARAANAFLRQLRPDDQVMAIKFSDQIENLFPLTRVRDFRESIKLKPKSREGDTILYDAVDYALKRMRTIKGRRAIVLFSDGVGVGIASAFGTLRDAEEQEALIYTIQFGSFSSEPTNGVSRKAYLKRIEEINGYMRNLALKTGGSSYHIETIVNIDKTFRQIAQELGQQYTLGYYPDETGKNGERRKIKVKVNVPNAVVRSRNEVIYKKSR